MKEKWDAVAEFMCTEYEGAGNFTGEKFREQVKKSKHVDVACFIIFICWSILQPPSLPRDLKSFLMIVLLI
jgi:hypothetical protein